jgi:ATP-dependent DNA ligase
MFKHACKTGLEGVVSKIRDSQYSSGRTNNWVKVTCAQRETLAIAGFALDGNKWDGLYVGRRKGADLIYAGKVDLGFDRESAKALRARGYRLISRASKASRPAGRSIPSLSRVFCPSFPPLKRGTQSFVPGSAQNFLGTAKRSAFDFLKEF